MSFLHSNKSFEGQLPDERVILFLHRHWLVMVLTLLGFFILALLPPLCFAALLFFNVSSAIGPFFFFVAILYYLLWWHGLSFKIAMYLLDYWIVTDKRIIDNDQRGFFNRKVAATNRDRVQDVSAEMNGFFETLFNFGNVGVETAGAEKKILFKQVPYPEKVKAIILELAVPKEKGPLV